MMRFATSKVPMRRGVNSLEGVRGISLLVRSSVAVATD
jgi:hypothetical protein